ncbi:TMEM165/GDT1 family protein [Thalassotalea sp. HSM 43]|uniref:TMEM165/GDT1 family protein n=1 Tax=Thalassotalea sp. HSM 43 TaxID=2552945 RepID=UPI00108022A0|nr:TMEM165/GDT1 family protein [Thalassotalea sp. HSM 43]QBY03486.1 TMEM165/GDT1 family protein [Thalassotalea sp. HSM 43]
MEILSSYGAVATFLLIFVAEFGDKSQLVCMTLAAKYRARPVLFGAISAFAILNVIAVLFGASFANFIDQRYLSIIAIVLFALFAISSWRDAHHDDDNDEGKLKVGKHISMSAFTLIFAAEMGDKTQLAVATLSTTQPPLMVWISATLALATTCVIGVIVGKKLLNRISEQLLSKMAALLFATFAVITAITTFA